MGPTPADDQRKEQRILAAIVFTDVVGFSKLASANEARVYTSLQRDMGVITGLCHQHSGQVLNTMGDGMLLCFTSAVDAMSCALDIQRALHQQAQSLPITDVLHHRIGVHLGDIIMSGDNVFGDGVNTAARLQAEAKPDAICFSRTVHEVIKNKIKIDAEYLAPRQLKNVGKVEIWQVPPIEDARQRELESIAAAPLMAAKESSGVAGYRAAGLIFAALLCVAGVIFFMKQAASKMPKSDATGSVMKGNNSNLKSMVSKNLKKIINSTAESGAAAEAENGITNPSKGPSTADLTAKLDSLKKSYAFDEIVTFMQGDGKDLPDANSLAVAYSDLSQMKHWMDAELNSATYNNPISITLTVSGTLTPMMIYRGNTLGSYTVLDPASGLSTGYGFSDLGQEGITAVVQGLITHPITQSQPSAPNWLTTFQRLYP